MCPAVPACAPEMVTLTSGVPVLGTQPSVPVFFRKSDDLRGITCVLFASVLLLKACVIERKSRPLKSAQDKPSPSLWESRDAHTLTDPGDSGTNQG